MEGIIHNFRQGRHHQKTAHVILIVEGIDSRDKTATLIDKPVVWKSPSGKEIKGIVKSAHGNKGAVRAIFEKGLPGQALATKVRIG